MIVQDDYVYDPDDYEIVQGVNSDKSCDIEQFDVTKKTVIFIHGYFGDIRDSMKLGKLWRI